MAERTVAHDDDTYRIDMAQWLSTSPSLSIGERSTLGALLGGHDATSLAHDRSSTVPRTREAISRARRAARQAYCDEVVAAV